MNDVNFHSKHSINRKRLTAIFDQKENKLLEVKLEVLYKHTFALGFPMMQELEDDCKSRIVDKYC